MPPLSKEFLASRTRCCGNGCYNCPYIPRGKAGSKEIDQQFMKTGKRKEKDESS